MRLPVSILVLTGAVSAAGAAVFLMAPAGPREAQVAEQAAPARGPERPAERTAAEVLPPRGHWQDPALDGGDSDVVRRIAPGAIAAPLIRQAALEREAPREPLSPKPRSRVQPGDLRKETRKQRLLFNPVATAAGRLEAEGHKIVVSGIEPVPVERVCRTEGKTVPCGMIARTAFRNWLRGRAVRCDVPDIASDVELASECTVAGADIATWLVEHGWAAPAGEAPQLSRADEKARARRAGLHAFAASAEPAAAN